MSRCNKCKKETSPHWSHRCYDCFFTPNVPKSVESATEVTTVRNSAEFSRIQKDIITELIKEVLDTTTVPLGPPAYTRLDMRIYMDTLKQKIKGNIACKLRNL